MDQIIQWKIRLIVMLGNTLQVNYLGDSSDILITLQSQFKEKQHEELCCRLITIKGQHAFKLIQFHQYEVHIIWRNL